MAEIYNEQMELIENPDLSLGWLEDTFRTEYHDAVEGVEDGWHYETIAEYPNGGRDVEIVVDVPGVEAVEAWEEQIPIQIYHPYTPEELEVIEAEKNRPTIEQRVTTLEEKVDGEMADQQEALRILGL